MVKQKLKVAAINNWFNLQQNLVPDVNVLYT